MAKPQKENGYTPIANEILEQIVKLPLNGTQFRILMVVWRYTYGFSRKEHDLSVTFIVNALGFNVKTQYKQISRELKKLITDNILLEVVQPDKNKTRIITFNKDYEVWTKKTSGLNRPVDGLDQRTKKSIDTETAENKDFETSGLNRPVDGLDHQENNDYYKTNIIYLNREEDELIKTLGTIKGYTVDRNKEIEMYKRLMYLYPEIYILAVVKEWAISKLDNPIKKSDNLRSQINTWCSNAQKWGKNKKTKNYDGYSRV